MNVKEYNECVEMHADALYRFVLKNLRNADVAKDVVQDSFEKLWLKAPHIEYSGAKSYLYTIAYHATIDVIRKEKPAADVAELPEFEQSGVSQAMPDLKRILDAGLKKLNEMQRSVILLRDYEGYSYAEIGEITGLNESQVKVTIYRARVALKDFIGKLDNVI